MSLLDSFVGFIKNTVGNNMDNNQGDVLAVKHNLNKTGYFDNFTQYPEPHGFITKEMDTGIRSFQKDKGLKVDGILLPRGETEKALHSQIQKTSGDIEREQLPPQFNNQTLIPGTSIIDKSVWEDEIPYKSRFDFTPNDKSAPMPQIIPSQPYIDTPMELLYSPDNKIFFRKYRDT